MLFFEEEKISTADKPKNTQKKADLSVFYKKFSDMEVLIREIQQASDSKSAVALSNRLLSSVNLLYRDMKEVLSRYLFSTYQKPPAVLQRPVKATVDYSDKVLYISFDCLPAKRIKNIYDINHTFSYCFGNALDDANSWYRQINGIIPRYREKVVIWYIVHYKKETNICDYDNYDFKPITDSISSLFLQDDAPQFISQFFDACEDTNDYLEIRVLPQTQF